MDMDKPVDKSGEGKRTASEASRVPGRTAKALSASAERVRRHREKMKAMGLKPVTIWVPDVDVNSPEFRADIKRQCELINAAPDSQIVLEGMLELADFSDWKA
jgi:hypothetical protein